MKDIQSLCARVRQTAYDIHLYYGHGHLEKVYENALAHRLRKTGLDVKQQYPIKVFDEDGTLIGDYYADLLVDGWLIVELKTAKALADEHVAQVLGYLMSARLEHGLLIDSAWLGRTRLFISLTSKMRGFWRRPTRGGVQGRRFDVRIVVGSGGHSNGFVVSALGRSPPAPR